MNLFRPQLNFSITLVIFAVFYNLSCKQTATTQPQLTSLKVQLNWVPEPEFGGLYAANERGFYKNLGLEVQIIGGGPSSPVVQLVATGQAHFGVAAAEDVLIARARGADIIAIFATFQSSPQAIMVHASRNLRSLAELKSGSLAFETGSAFASFLRKKYDFQGVTLLPSEGGVAKFLIDSNYAQQCYLTSEPIIAQRKGVAVKVFQARETGFNPYANVIITRSAFLKEQSALVRNFVQATQQGWQAYLKDPNSTHVHMRKLNRTMDDETFSRIAEMQRALIETDETQSHTLGTMNESRWATLSQQLFEIGIIPKLVLAKDCFTLDMISSPK